MTGADGARQTDVARPKAREKAPLNQMSDSVLFLNHSQFVTCLSVTGFMRLVDEISLIRLTAWLPHTYIYSRLFLSPEPCLFFLSQAARIIAKLAAWGRDLMEGSDLNYYFNWIKSQLSSQVCPLLACNVQRYSSFS